MGILDFLFGRWIVSTPAANAPKLLNLLMKYEIEYSSPTLKNSLLYLECTKSDYLKLKEICENRNIQINEEKTSGIPKIFEKYKMRPGLLVGVALTLVMTAYALNVVWRIDVSGNESISSGEIEALLGESGFSVGSYIPTADLTLIENNLMQKNPDIAWISVNINGAVAKVEIRETHRALPKNDTPSNLVAVRDGKIERIESYDGNCLVKVGDVVRAGDLLVSGIYQNNDGSIRTTSASGEIYARTLREIFVEIPFENTQKSYSGRKFHEIYINFFKKSIKVFANTGKMVSSCDIIYKNGRLGLPVFPEIPVGFEVTEYCEYEILPNLIDEEAAMELAFKALEQELGRLSQDIELLKKDIEFEINEKSYILRCQLVCVENIAVVKEIE